MSGFDYNGNTFKPKYYLVASSSEVIPGGPITLMKPFFGYSATGDDHFVSRMEQFHESERRRLELEAEKEGQQSSAAS